MVGGLLDKSLAKEEIIKAKGVYLESSLKKILDATSGWYTKPGIQP